MRSVAFENALYLLPLFGDPLLLLELDGVLLVDLLGAVLVDLLLRVGQGSPLESIIRKLAEKARA